MFCSRWPPSSTGEWMLLHFFFSEHIFAQHILPLLHQSKQLFLESGSLRWLMLNCVEKTQKVLLSSRKLHHLSFTFPIKLYLLYNCSYGERFSEEIILQFTQKVFYEHDCPDIFSLLGMEETATWETFFSSEASSALCAFNNLTLKDG